MKTQQRIKAFKLSALTAALLASIAAHASEPFSPYPLHLTSNAASKTKPNVLLVIDNSGSMNWIPGADLFATEAIARDSCKIYMTSPRDQLTWFSHNQATGYLPPYNYGPMCKIYHANNLTVSLYPNRHNCDSEWVKNHTTPAECALPPAQRKSRMEILKNVMNSILINPKHQDLRWGVSYYHTANLNKANNIPIGDNKAELVRQSIQNAIANGGTPTSSVFATAIEREFLRDNSPTIQYRCQKNFVILLSDGAPDSNGTTNVSAYQWYRNNWEGTNTVDGSKWSNKTDLRVTNANTGKVEYPASLMNFMNSSSYGWGVTNNLGMMAPYVHRKLGLYAMTHILANKDLRTLQKNGTDNEGGSWDDKDFSNGKQTISTSTVGFLTEANSGFRDATEFLQNGAQGENAEYYPVKNAEDLMTAFSRLVTKAVTSGVAYSTTAPNVSGSTVNLSTLSLSLDLTKGYSALEFLNLTRNQKSGELEAAIDKSRSINFGSLTNNSQQSDRRVLMSNATTAPTFLNANHLASFVGSGSANAQNYVDWIIRNSSKRDSELGGLRVRVDNSGTSTDDSPTNKARMMGDVISAPVLQVGAVELKGTANQVRFTPYLVAAANDGMVHVFKRDDANTAKPYSLKMNWIPGAAKRDDGNKTMWDALKNTADKNYLGGSEDDAQKHNYLLNGGLTYRETYKGQYFAVGALGQGGKGVYALNVGGKDHIQINKAVGIDAGQNEWASSVPLWESGNPTFGATDATTRNANNQLGYTVGSPVIDRIAMKRDANKKPMFNDATTPIRYVAAVANGYFGSDNTPTLYLYDALGVAMTYKVDDSNRPTAADAATANFADRGKLLGKIVVTPEQGNNASITVRDDGGKNIMNNGLSSPTLVDMDDDGVVDVAYAGDLRGNMYRFDLRGTAPSEWKSSMIFKGSDKNPITAAPAIWRDKKKNQVIVMFGTGRDLFTSDLDSKDEQYFYAVYDDLNKTWEAACATGTSETCQSLVKAETRDTVLLQQKISNAGAASATGERYRKLPNFNAESMQMDSKQGWYIPLHIDGLAQTGERVVTQPVVVNNSVFFTTRIYQKAADDGRKCTKANTSGYSWVMGANVQNGSNLSAKTTNLGKKEGVGFYAGFSLVGISSQPMFASNSEGLVKPFARNDQGQVRDGYDKDLTDPQTDEHIGRYCGKESPGDLTVIDSSMGFSSRKLTNAICPSAHLKRISWREIF